jgi:hypothetical protein
MDLLPPDGRVQRRIGLGQPGQQDPAASPAAFEADLAACLSNLATGLSGWRAGEPITT